MPAFLSHDPTDLRRRPASRRGALAAWFGQVLAGLALLVVLVPGPSLAAAKQTPAQKEAELRKLNQRIDKVRKSVNADVQKRDKLSVQLREAELGVQSARKELDEIRAQRLAAEARVRDLEAEQARREKELDGERAELAGELRTAYVNGREEQLKLLLNQEDPANFGRMLAYYGYFGRARAERIRGIQDQLEHLALVREKIVAEKSRLESLEQQREQRVADLQVVAGQARAGRQRDRPADQVPGRRAEAAAVAGQITREAHHRAAPGHRTLAAGSARAQGRLVRHRGQAGPVRAPARQAAVAGAGRRRSSRSSVSPAPVARCAGRAC